MLAVSRRNKQQSVRVLLFQHITCVHVLLSLSPPAPHLGRPHVLAIAAAALERGHALYELAAVEEGGAVPQLHVPSRRVANKVRLRAQQVGGGGGGCVNGWGAGLQTQ